MNSLDVHSFCLNENNVWSCNNASVHLDKVLTALNQLSEQVFLAELMQHPYEFLKIETIGFSLSCLLIVGTE